MVLMNIQKKINTGIDNNLKKRRAIVSSNQLQFWMIEKIHPGTSAYNIPAVCRLKGNLDTESLENSINEIIKRHDIYRTTFFEEQNYPFQIISSDLFIKLDKIDLSNLSFEEKEERLKSLIESEINTLFDLEKGPLIRTKLFKLSESEHVISITMHHIITDPYSKELFSSELSAFYNAFHKNQDIAVKIPHQYSDYAYHQQEWFNSKECSKMTAFWNKQLEGKKQFLDFPIDKQYPTVLTLRGNEYYFDIPQELSTSLKEYSHRESIDIATLFLTAYYILLYRYSSQVEITVGVPHTNRHRDDFKNIMGCLMNIMPIQINFSDKITSREIISSVRESLLLTYPNQELPLEKIVNSIQLETGASSNPLFQYGFTFEHPMKFDLQNIESESIETNLFGSTLNIFAVLWDNITNYNGRFLYNTDLFERSTIERLKNNYITLLESIVSSADIPVSKLNVLSDHERNIINEWNNTSCAYSDAKCIHTFLEEQSIKNPDDMAVIFEGTSLSFRELNSHANRLAHHLISAGIKTGSMIGMCMDRSLEMIIAIYAILKSGGVYVPIDSSYPEDRLSFIIDDAKISRIITHKQIAPKIEKLKCGLIIIDSELTGFEGLSENNPDVNLTQKDIAYIIYTSGSTGKPKGVMIEHHSVVNRLEWMQKKYPIAKGDVILQKTTVTFDVSIWELFWWSFYGATVCMLIQGGEKDPEAIVDAVEKNRVTVMHFVPSMLHAFLEYLKIYESSKKLASLKQVFASGEALQLNDVQAFTLLLAITNSTKLSNLYGPTEATVDVSYFDCIEGFDRVPIGKPIDNIKLYIVDTNFSITPIGVPGELIIGGVGVARGYLNRPELNSEKFIPNPILPDGTLFYRTGDLARYLPDGNIEYLGRMDYQVKIRGFRIELGEIETVLNSSKFVSESVVMPIENGPNEKRLVAFIVSDKNNSRSIGNIQQLKDYLKEKLPDYMIPASFIMLDKFPLSSNGKIDRKSLLAMKLDSQLNNCSYTAPKDETEIKIVSYWCKLLNLEKVGIDDNFFDIGGNSLLALQLQFKLSKEFNKKIEIVKMFEFPTIRGFAKFITSGSSDSGIFNKVEDRMGKRMEAMKKRRNRLE
jgi:amino acid adenylation domain-containing protein